MSTSKKAPTPPVPAPQAATAAPHQTAAPASASLVGFRSGRLSPSDMLAMQRTMGNRAVQRHITRAPALPQAMPIQRMTVKLIGAGEEGDFERTEPQVRAFRGEQPIDWHTVNFADLGTGDELTIWAHMDSYAIGGVPAQAFVQALLTRGFKTCRALRLLGCNQTKDPSAIISRLRMALNEFYPKVDQREALLSFPMYALRGPLHSGIRGTILPAEEWWVGLKTPEEETLDTDYKEAKKKIEQNMFKQLEKYNAKDRSKITDPEELKASEARNEQYVEETYGPGLEILEAEWKRKVKNLREKLHSEGRFPQIGTPSQDGAAGGWTKEAWAQG